MGCARPLRPRAAGPRRRRGSSGCGGWKRRAVEERGEAAAATRPARSEGAAAKTPSAAVPGTAHDLLFSFTKKGKGKKKKKKGRKRRGKKIAPRATAVTGSAHRGARLVERGLGAGRGRGKKGIGCPAAPPPAPPRGASLSLPPSLPSPLPEARDWEGLGSPPVAVSSLYLARGNTSLDSHGVFPFPPGS